MLPTLSYLPEASIPNETVPAVKRGERYALGFYRATRTGWGGNFRGRVDFNPGGFGKGSSVEIHVQDIRRNHAEDRVR